ncbi:SH3 domain-containing protein [Echinicola shivajiensis]|uniref:SH3 domain-containing protein n=1 Tax=Echinicola shivajiensis TaxID=1035916 RepID=UPI001BFC2125|nr:SH3 domain-containing protein [Echinicola shivajiensis]
MKKLIFLLYFTVWGGASIASNFTAGSTVFVIDFQGTELKKKPNSNAKVLDMLLPGDPLTIINNTNKSIQFSIFVQFHMNGVWLEVKTADGRKGYIFSGDVSNIPPQVDEFPYQPLRIDLLGDEIKTDTYKDSVNIYGQLFEVDSEKTTFDHGTYIISSYEGCQSRIYSFTELSFNEVFHQMRNMYLSIDEETGEVISPRLIRRNENEFVFSLPKSSGEVKIVVQKNGVIDIQTFYCS